MGDTGLLRGSTWGSRLLKDWTLSGGATASSGGLQLTVHDGENGFLAPVGDAAAFADRLAAVLRNPILARHMSLRARRSAEPYSWTAVAERTHCLYESLVTTCTREAASQ